MYTARACINVTPIKLENPVGGTPIFTQKPDATASSADSDCPFCNDIRRSSTGSPPYEGWTLVSVGTTCS